MASNRVVEQAAFREAMARFASGVTVVTTMSQEGRPVGFTATAFASLSLDPPLILTCLDKGAQSYPVFQESAQFAVSILSEGQADMALRFAARGTDKFAGLDMDKGEITDLPLLPGASVQLECRLYQELAGGDHAILVGEVLSAQSNDNPPLLHFNRKFGSFEAS